MHTDTVTRILLLLLGFMATSHFGLSFNSVSLLLRRQTHYKVPAYSKTWYPREPNEACKDMREDQRTISRRDCKE